MSLSFKRILLFITIFNISSYIKPSLATIHSRRQKPYYGIRKKPEEKVATKTITLNEVFDDYKYTILLNEFSEEYLTKIFQRIFNLLSNDGTIQNSTIEDENILQNCEVIDELHKKVSEAIQNERTKNILCISTYDKQKQLNFNKLSYNLKEKLKDTFRQRSTAYNEHLSNN